jgi:acetate kinase
VLIVQILAFNSGSSSIKCALLDSETGRWLLTVRVENIDSDAGRCIVGDVASPIGRIDHAHAIELVMSAIQEQLSRHNGIQAVVHRIVHGGADFTQPTLIDDNVFAAIERVNAWAPLHNPPALAVLRAARRALSTVPHVAVFDTAFHATLPTRAREYALPRELVTKFAIRRFGFHGINHAHVALAVGEYLRADPRELRIVSCHLGNGASVTAIEYGRSVDTSMGMTPLEGVMMGTRGGDIDPGVLLMLLKDAGVDATGLDRILNHESGLQGLTGTMNMAEIEQRASQGDESCRLAITMYAHRIRKYVGAYVAVMGGVDAIVFTGGVGEHSALVRHRVSQRFEFCGAVLDEDRNRDAQVSAAEPIARVSAEVSRVHILVVQADEEAQMARETAALLNRESIASQTKTIPVAISARHAHLSNATVEKLFGAGYQLRTRAPLSQPGQFAAQETVTLIGPRGRIEQVRLMGPSRQHDQIEISRSDEFLLGIDAPVRLSGDVANTPGITLEGPLGRVTIPSGVICARRHIHMHPNDASTFGVKDRDVVEVKVDSDGRDLVFGDVVVRVAPTYALELHLDTDEANAAGISGKTQVELLTPTPGRASITARRRGGTTA